MKTISAKLLCNEIDIPTIIVNNSFEGHILEFIQSLEFECVILVDEAEKTFTKEDDEILLKLIDGVYNKSRKLYILTTNRLTVNENLLGRPGRIRYIQEFSNLPAETVEAYIDDNLEDKSKKEEILQEVDLLEISTIDIIKALVEEVNIMGELGESNPMNVPKAKHIFDVLRLSGCTEDDKPKITEFLNTRPQDKSLFEWMNSSEKVGDDEVDMTDKLEESVPSCNYAYITRMTSVSGILWDECTTSLGTVNKKPDDLGFFTIRDNYDGDDTLYLLLRKRNNPSLYKGGLGLVY